MQTVLVTALTVLVGGVLLKFVIDGIYNDSFARTFVDVLVFLNINEKTAVHLYWQLIGDNKTFFMIVGYLILFALFFYVALSQMTKYLDQIDHGIENIISESTDPIHLITELKPIEIRLNEIKATLKRQELEAQLFSPSSIPDFGTNFPRSLPEPTPGSETSNVSLCLTLLVVTESLPSVHRLRR